MVKHEKEMMWGAMLGVLQTDADKLVMALKKVLGEIGVEMEKCHKGCLERGEIVENSREYQRLFHLYTALGGIYYCVQGSDGMLSAIIVDMLSGMDFVDSENSGANR